MRCFHKVQQKSIESKNSRCTKQGTATVLLMIAMELNGGEHAETRQHILKDLEGNSAFLTSKR
jgi:hypothetical protein